MGAKICQACGVLTDVSFSLLLKVLDNLVEQIIQELVSILMHRTPEQSVLLLELADEGLGCDNTLAGRMLSDM